MTTNGCMIECKCCWNEEIYLTRGFAEIDQRMLWMKTKGLEKMHFCMGNVELFAYNSGYRGVAGER